MKRWILLFCMCFLLVGCTKETEKEEVTTEKVGNPYNEQEVIDWAEQLYGTDVEYLGKEMNEDTGAISYQFEDDLSEFTLTASLESDYDGVEEVTYLRTISDNRLSVVSQMISPELETISSDTVTIVEETQGETTEYYVYCTEDHSGMDVVNALVELYRPYYHEDLEEYPEYYFVQNCPRIRMINQETSQMISQWSINDLLSQETGVEI